MIDQYYYVEVLEILQNYCNLEIHNFTSYKIYNIYIKIFSNNYRHHITNDFKKLTIKEKNKENIIILIASVLIIIEKQIV